MNYSSQSMDLLHVVNKQHGVKEAMEEVLEVATFWVLISPLSKNMYLPQHCGPV